MRKTIRWLRIVLTVIFCLALSLLLVACNDDKNNDKTAYELYKEQYGYEGTEEQWLKDLLDGSLFEDNSQDDGQDDSQTNYTVVFDIDGQRTSVTVAEGEKIPQPDNPPSKQGYTFDGWYTGRYNDEKWVFSQYTVNGDITLTAKYVANTYTLTFDINGADSSEIYPTQKKYGETFELPSLSRGGYAFAGWLCGGKLVEDEIVVSGDMHFVAKWVAPSYSVTFDSNGGSETDSITVNYGEEFSLPVPTRQNAYFLGWFNGDEKVEDGVWKFEQDLNLTAKWAMMATMFEYADNGDTVTITKYIGSETDVVVPTSLMGKPVSAVAAAAFSGNTSLTSLTFDGSLYNYPQNMLSGCVNIKKLTISSAYDGTLPDLFGGISNVPSSLVTIEYAKNSPSISKAMWQRPVANHDVELILADDFTLASSQFAKCAYLVSVTIPNNMTAIPYHCFENCAGLKTVKFQKNSILKYINESAFYGCSSLTEIVIPSSVIDIGMYAFRYCSSLTEIVIPDGVITITRYAFYGCSSLTKIEIPDSVTTIGDYTFYECSSLTEVVIPDSVTIIDDYVFAGCSSLTKIEIPDSVTTIGGCAFSLCGLTEIVIPDSVILIGGGAFAGCSLTEIVIPDSVGIIGFDAFHNTVSLQVIYCESEVPLAGWEDGWNSGHTVVYGYKGALVF